MTSMLYSACLGRRLFVAKSRFASVPPVPRHDSQRHGGFFMVERKCRACGISFLTYRAEIKKGGGKNCSVKCKSISMKVRTKRICAVCKKTFLIRPWVLKIKKGRYCSRKCFSKLKGKMSPVWRGGSWTTKEGYVMVHCGVRYYRPEHRVLMERFLGRKLRKYEVVHHKNHIRNDNRIKNLEVMTASGHMKHHHAKRRMEE